MLTQLLAAVKQAFVAQPAPQLLADQMKYTKYFITALKSLCFVPDVRGDNFTNARTKVLQAIFQASIAAGRKRPRPIQSAAGAVVPTPRTTATDASGDSSLFHSLSASQPPSAPPPTPTAARGGAAAAAVATKAEPQKQEKAEEEEEEEEALPYAGDMQVAVRAQDRDAIRKIMAARKVLQAILQASIAHSEPSQPGSIANDAASIVGSIEAEQCRPHSAPQRPRSPPRVPVPNPPKLCATSNNHRPSVVDIDSAQMNPGTWCVC